MLVYISRSDDQLHLMQCYCFYEEKVRARVHYNQRNVIPTVRYNNISMEFRLERQCNKACESPPENQNAVLHSRSEYTLRCAMHIRIGVIRGVQFHFLIRSRICT